MSTVLLYRNNRYCMNKLRHKANTSPLIKVKPDEVMQAPPVNWVGDASDPHPSYPLVTPYDGAYVILSPISPELQTSIAYGKPFEARLVSTIVLKAAKL